MAIVTMSCGCDVPGMPEPGHIVGRRVPTRCDKHKVTDVFVTEMAQRPAPPRSPVSVRRWMRWVRDESTRESA